MVSERYLLVLAAERRELSGLPVTAPLRSRRVRYVAATLVGGRMALAAANGPGRENAAQAVAALAQEFALDGVVSTGYAGALDPDFAVGDLFVPSAVFGGESAVEYPVSLEVVPPDGARFSTGALLTIDRVAQTAAEKRTLRESSGAAAVDMEAAGVFQAARDLDLSAAAVRVVSDSADADFPFDFNRARRADGTFSGWNIVRQAGWKPYHWRRLLSLKKDADRASRALGDFLTQCRFQTQ